MCTYLSSPPCSEPSCPPYVLNPLVLPHVLNPLVLLHVLTPFVLLDVLFLLYSSSLLPVVSSRYCHNPIWDCALSLAVTLSPLRHQLPSLLGSQQIT